MPTIVTVLSIAALIWLFEQAWPNARLAETAHWYPRAFAFNALQAAVGSNKAAITSARSAAQKVDANNDDFANDDDAYYWILDRNNKDSLQFDQVHVWSILQRALEFFEEGAGLGVDNDGSGLFVRVIGNKLLALVV